MQLKENKAKDHYSDNTDLEQDWHNVLDWVDVLFLDILLQLHSQLVALIHVAPSPGFGHLRLERLERGHVVVQVGRVALGNHNQWKDQNTEANSHCKRERMLLHCNVALGTWTWTTRGKTRIRRRTVTVLLAS